MLSSLRTKISQWFSSPTSLLVRPAELVPAEGGCTTSSGGFVSGTTKTPANASHHQRQQARWRTTAPSNVVSGAGGGIAKRRSEVCSSTAASAPYCCYSGGGGAAASMGAATVTAGASVLSSSSLMLPPPPLPPPPLKKRVTKRTIEIKCLPDRACEIGDFISSRRSLINEVRCGVPLLLSDLEPSMADANDDLIVVELRSCEGSAGWLDDRSLSAVLVGDEILPMAPLRHLVQSRVPMTGSHKRNLAKSVYGICNPQDCGSLLVTLVPVLDLRQELLGAEGAPQ